MQELTHLEDSPLEVEVLEDLSPQREPGFLWLRRQRCQLRLADGSASGAFIYDSIGRQALDAVVIVPHFLKGDRRCVFLTSSIRPPLAARDASRIAGDGPRHCVLWELPAGLIEPGEVGEAGARAAAKRELLEEIGFDVEERALSPLGKSSFPAPGVIAERHFFFEVEVDPRLRVTPTLDGSVLEKHSEVGAFELEVALAACRTGRIEDAKTELGLRRLKEMLS